jgi:hypothetical protein
MNLQQQILQYRTRRQFLGTSGVGLGSIALASLLGNHASANTSIDPTQPQQPRKTHAPAKAKRVIYLHMTGSPPILDLFDYKPELIKREGQNCPDEFLKGKRFAFTSGVPKLMGTPHKFQRHGQSGALFSDALPHLAKQADDLTFIKSMTTDQFNHAPAELLLYTGSSIAGRPSMGSWVTYGLGSENQDLPGFVTLISSGVQPNGGKNSFGSGFLPSVFQGVQCRSKGDPVLYVSDPKGLPRQLRRTGLDTLNELNRIQGKELGSPETLTRIAQYEMAFRMQTSVPEVMDITKEPKHMLEAYGATPGGASLANNCLLARRLVEKGVRFVHLFDWGWDFHGTNPGEALGNGLRKKCATMDKPVAALIRDLKQRGLLEDTLVVWGGEFGRTPFREGRTAKGKNLGRDHFPDVYTMMLAGGGTKPGYTHGSSDELGFKVATDKVHVHDLQATILHLLGIDHERLTFKFQGRQYRLTDVHGHVVNDIIA